MYKCQPWGRPQVSRLPSVKGHMPEASHMVACSEEALPIELMWAMNAS